MDNRDVPGPLAGIRVLDLTRALSGPFATMILGDLGADVIKLEDTWHGDDTRRWGPPFQGDDASYFLSINRNKRGLSVNLKEPRGQQIAQRLALATDVMLENFRPGTAARLGLGYQELSERNPRLIYASISGYGQTGPSAALPGYDAVAQAISGMMSVTGEAGGEPVRSGTSLADVGAGMYAVIGILAALHARESTGRGQQVDIALLDGQLSWLTYVAGKYFATGATPGRFGSAHESVAPYQVFPTADEPLMVAVGSDGLWRRFTAATGLDDLTDDPRYATNPARVSHRDTLVPAITKALAARGCDQWAEILNAAGVRRPGQHGARRAGAAAGRRARDGGGGGASGGRDAQDARQPAQAVRAAGQLPPPPADPGPAHRPGAGRGRVHGRRDHRTARRGHHQVRPGGPLPQPCQSRRPLEQAASSSRQASKTGNLQARGSGPRGRLRAGDL